MGKWKERRARLRAVGQVMGTQYSPLWVSIQAAVARAADATGVLDKGLSPEERVAIIQQFIQYLTEPMQELGGPVAMTNPEAWYELAVIFADAFKKGDPVEPVIAGVRSKMGKIAMDDEAEKPQSAQSSEGGDMNPEDEFLRRKHEVALHVRFLAQGFPATIAKKFIAGIEALAAELVVENVQVDIEGFTPLD